MNAINADWSPKMLGVTTLQKNSSQFSTTLTPDRTH